MSYDEEQQRRSRVVVETPTARREVDYQQTRYVQPDRGGYSTGVVVAVALTAIAATAIIFLFLMNSGDDETNVNVSARIPATQPSPLLVQQATPLPTPFPTLPTPLPPLTQTAPGVTVIDPTLPPASGTTTTTTAPPAAPAPTPNVPDEGVIKNNVNSKINSDPDLSATDILADVRNGKVTLTGSVPSPDLKRRAERLAFSVKGVRLVDNQITVVDAAPDATP
ncbi:MAG TPA: BON domain-containing protein [Pyrinomonadaceae bacterium]|nr:BON domain-containing protein [Pyrinomonadaceae bacterium]